ncbi:MAG: PTS sugar transporter subunit IIA [Myxococcales bacterium]|nr:PTS sugar transporter subunit IIA [Myxococcales bacterium]MCB9737128.1 PTS sugar transporter subunit IIA [Deltaproteobacteria bacterium]
MDGSSRSGPDIRSLALDAATADEVFRGVARLCELDEAVVAKALGEREAVEPTDIGDGVAVPHGKIESLDHGVIVDVTLKRSVSWGAGRGAVKRCLCVLEPGEEREAHAALLAEAARRAGASS